MHRHASTRVPPPHLSKADHARLVHAAYKGDLPQLRRSSNEKPAFRQAVFGAVVNDDGWNVLMLSTLFCHMEVIEWLLSGCTSTAEEGGEEEEEDEEEAGNRAAQTSLMINQQDREGITAVFLAAYHNHQSLLALLLAHGADPNKQHKDGLSPLGVAIYRGHLTLVREVLLPHPRLDIDARDDVGGRTALFQAAYWGKTKALQLLLRERSAGGGGADPMLLTELNISAVQVARVKGHGGCVALLEEWERAFWLHKLRCVHDTVLARQAATTLHSPFSTKARASSSSSSLMPRLPRWLRGRAGSGEGGGARGQQWLQLHMANNNAAKDQQQGEGRIGGREGTQNHATTAAVLGMVVEELKGDLYGELRAYVGRTCGWWEEGR